MSDLEPQWHFPGTRVRIVGDASYAFVRDADGKISSVHDTTHNRLFLYSYDDAGMRVRKRSLGGDQFVDKLYVTPEYEVNLSEAEVSHQVHVFSAGVMAATLQRPGVGDAPGENSQDVLQYHPNHLGTNEVLSSGVGLVSREVYMDPFGGDRLELAGPGAVPGVESAYRFTGQEADEESGLDYFGARFYDPVAGRFASQDPATVGFARSVTFDRIPADSQQQSTFGYVGGRPTTAIDPTGAYEVGLVGVVETRDAEGNKSISLTNDIQAVKSDIARSNGSSTESGSALTGPVPSTTQGATPEPQSQSGREGTPAGDGATPTVEQMQDFVDTAVRETDKLIESGKVPRAADYIVDDVKFSPKPNTDNPNLAGKNEIASGPINRGTITIYPRGATSLREAFVTYGHELGHFNRNWTNSERLLDRYGGAIWDVYQGGTYSGPRP